VVIASSRRWFIGGLLLGCGAAHDVSAAPARTSSAGATSAPTEVVAPLATPQASVLASDAGVRSLAPPSLADVLAALPPGSSSTSIGSPTNGRLEGGVALPLHGEGFRYNDKRSRDARYGTVELVRAIVRAAHAVQREHLESELVVNDIGLEHGGRISHHGSHRAGRDADLLFFLRDDAGSPIAPVGAPLDPEGIGFDYKDLSVPDDDVRVHFDAARTWSLIAALLGDGESPVQRIFVVEHLRAMLLAEAERTHAPAALLSRFADVTCQPSYPHDDHLHVRWFCSAEDLRAGCEDAAPLYPWRAAQLAAEGVTPVIAKRARSEDPAPVVTQEAAEKAVLRAAPHADVLAFLKRRKAWEKQPHPGRPYCR
jgi:penicillin-insensitive murein DD-endopeptidase